MLIRSKDKVAVWDHERMTNDAAKAGSKLVKRVAFLLTRLCNPPIPMLL